MTDVAVSPAPDRAAALDRIKLVAAAGAAAADRDAAFPSAAVAALGMEGLLAAAVPTGSGGLGYGLEALLETAHTVARCCGSTAMIWAMHQVQAACVARHGSPRTAELLAALARDNALIASATSERGVGGNLGVSRTAVHTDGGRCSLEKQASTVSYGRQAGALLVTARRHPGSADGDQVAVLVLAAQARLEPVGVWNPMGMRGTDSPAMHITATFDADQILPVPFSVVAAETMIPLSHLLWSAVWTGLATEAFERARRLVRARPGSAASPDPRLALADEILSGLEARLADTARRYEPCYRGRIASTMSQLVRWNALKAAASIDAVRVAELALEICGMAGYQEEGPYSVARVLRDLYSARLMVANDRLRTTNAANLLTVRRG